MSVDIKCQSCSQFQKDTVTHLAARLRTFFPFFLEVISVRVPRTSPLEAASFTSGGQEYKKKMACTICVAKMLTSMADLRLCFCIFRLLVFSCGGPVF